MWSYKERKPTRDNVKNLLLPSILFLAAVITMQAQSFKTQTLLDSIQGEYAVDDNQNLTYSRIVECPGMTKKQIYDRAQAWFVYNYNSGKAVIQVQDSTTGTVIGKGFYDKVSVGMYMLTTVELDAWHIVRIDAKDGKFRVIITLTEWERVQHGSNGSAHWPNTHITNEYPFNKRGKIKNIMGQAFFALHNRTQATFLSLEKSVKDGSTSKSIEGNDW